MSQTFTVFLLEKSFCSHVKYLLVYRLEVFRVVNYTSVAFLSCTLHVRLPLLLNVHSSRGLLLVMHAMAPALVFCFLTFKQFCRLVLVDKMVNPLPIRNSWKTFKQKVQELFQLLLNNPLRTLVTLVITRGLWIPFIKYTYLLRTFCATSCGTLPSD